MTVPDPPTDGGNTANGSDGSADVLADAHFIDLLGRMSSDVTRLVHDELELAKAEIKQEAANTVVAAGFLSGTALSGYFVLLMLSFSAAFGLAEVMAAGFAFLIVGLFYVAVAGTLFVLGRKKLATVSLVPKTTVRTLREDLSWLRQQTS